MVDKLEKNSSLKWGKILFDPSWKKKCITNFDKQINDYIENYFPPEHKAFLIAKKKNWIQQACDNVGVHHYLVKNPAFFPKYEREKILNEIKSPLILTVSAPKWHNRGDQKKVTEQLKADDIESQTKERAREHKLATDLFFEFLNGEMPSLKEIWQLLPAIFYEKDEVILKDVRKMVDSLFEEVYSILKETPPTKKNINFHYETIIYNLLAYYTYIDPDEGRKIKIPQLIDNEWKQITYSIKHINLTDPKLGSQIRAFGLTPSDDAAFVKDAPPLLLFKGTTYPTDDGCLLSTLADLDPHNGVGGFVFNEACSEKGALKKWIDDATKEGKKIRVTGQSLGGSLAQKAAVYFADQVEFAFAYDPPGLSKYDVALANQQTQAAMPKVHVICQQNDPVHILDEIPANNKNWEYYRVFGNENLPGSFLAHAMAFSLHNKSIIAHMNREAEAQRTERKVLTAFKKFFSLPLFYGFLLLLAISRRISFKDIFNGRFREHMVPFRNSPIKA